jgi:hypothetical protein
MNIKTDMDRETDMDMDYVHTMNIKTDMDHETDMDMDYVHVHVRFTVHVGLYVHVKSVNLI